MAVSKTSKCYKEQKNENGTIRYIPTNKATEEEKTKLERFNRLLDYVAEYFKTDISCDY